MKEKNGKKSAIEPSDFNYSLSEIMSCNKHPNPSNSQIGICAHCLKEKLVKLVCSDCGEQRLSSCYCSDFSSSYRNSCSTLTDIGSVGRISFLLENENNNNVDVNKNPIFLRRSTSSCVEIINNGENNGNKSGFWKLFKKKERFEKSSSCVSRSRSLCSFRGNYDYNYNRDMEATDHSAFSSVKISDAIENEMIRKESDFKGMDESKFIDLNLNLMPETIEESSKSNGLFGIERGGGGGMKRKSKSKSHKVWKWIFRQNNYNSIFKF